jgi:large subunit ribosomal protein L25
MVMKKLTISQRKDLKKGATNTIRREGDVPAVIYGRGRENENIVVKGIELQAILRNLESGLLATTVFELHDGKKVHKAIVKEIAYHRATYAVEHIDFAVLDDTQPITLNVPIHINGLAECPGIKLGGFLRQVLRTLKVSCLPKDIPSKFTLDVGALNMTEAKRLSDIEMPASVRPMGRMNEVAVVIAKGKTV